MSGGGRYAGERAWNAPHAAGHVIGLVAVFTEDEADTGEAATLLTELDPDDLRVVNENGAWHLPNTFA